MIKYNDYRQHFNMTKPYFSFDYQNVHFLAMASAKNSIIPYKYGSEQYNFVAEDLSRAWFKFAVVHQPFVTVKSDHSPNGEFDCYDPLFRAGRIDGILQAHNHNYQRFNIHGLMYGVFGTGTHDTGSSMYPLASDTWQGNDCLKCITGENGITIIDLNLNNMNSKHFVGWFLNTKNQVLDRFESSVG